MIFPAIYYEFSGSGGNYDVYGTSSSQRNIVIATIFRNSFMYCINKSTGDNVNCYICVQAVYSDSFNFLKTYN
mgnify:CR=1 FL=1